MHTRVRGALWTTSAPVPTRRNPAHRLVRTHGPQNQTFRTLMARNEWPSASQIQPGGYLSVYMYVHTHTPHIYSLYHPAFSEHFSAPQMDVTGPGGEDWAQGILSAGLGHSLGDHNAATQALWAVASQQCSHRVCSLPPDNSRPFKSKCRAAVLWRTRKAAVGRGPLL